jgi:hypothetical protein
MSNVAGCMALVSAASGARNTFFLSTSLCCVMHNLDISPGQNDSVVIHKTNFLYSRIETIHQSLDIVIGDWVFTTRLPGLYDSLWLDEFLLVYSTHNSKCFVFSEDYLSFQQVS